MSRWIDADAFERAVMFSDDEDLQDVIYRLRDYPSIDLVRCGECRHCLLDLVVERRVDGYEKTVNLCRHPKHTEEWSVPKDWYCADGVRRESE